MYVKKTSGRDEASLQYYLIYSVCFMIFLVAVAVSRLLPTRLRWNVSGHDSGRSVFQTARIAAGSCVPFAFM
jgi:hypothetical protein